MSDSKETLRDRYLQLLLHVTKEAPKATFYMHGGTTVQGNLRGTDSENNRFRVDQLESPLGLYEHAVLRGTDIDMIEYSIQK
ncbi:SMN complex, gem-associated protein 7 [Gilbertella persicaria]|uniref:Uncharacterized protein n=1 Tax=Rhizopus stolonifer TaxID=4846 RepID=A0A367KV29_RHIST|nr:SMN complex, gem-associated protein 7 [Gilbertella persicaria]KAI8047243.1 SMN complex, gem-associated protein 7 [Gilbertella persicaria]RCI06059.1 hypothetical protein CU098_010087 [Rhizopus stolonifer]